MLPIFGQQPDYVGDPYPMVTNESPTAPVPVLAANFRAGRLAIGAGLFAPHAPTPRSFSDTVVTQSGAEAPAPQRYDTLGQTGMVAFPSLAVAYDFGRLRLGLRGSYGFSKLETTRVQQVLGNDGESPRFDARADVKASDGSIFIWGAGAQLELTKWIEVGAAYSSAVEMNAVGEANVELSDFVSNIPGDIAVDPVPDAMAQCAPGGSRGAIKTCVDIVLPATANFGVRLVQRDSQDRETGDIEIDLRWENWGAASQQRAVIDGQDSVLGTPLGETIVETGFHNSWSLRVGGSKSVRASWGRIEVRAGAGYDGPAKPKQWAVISNDGAARWSGSGGLAIERGRFRVDVGGFYASSDTVTVTDGPVSDSGQADQPTTSAPFGGVHAFNPGTYYNRYWIGSLGIQAGW